MNRFPEYISRRVMLAGASAATAISFAGGMAFAKAPLLKKPGPAYYRFMVGSIEVTVVSDGPLALGEPKPEMFSGLSKEKISQSLTDNFLPVDNMTLEQNSVILNTGQKLVLFDTGTGATKMFGDKSGRQLANLRAAGIDPKNIDAVVLTHAHPDHCWGLMGAKDVRNFPNAQIYMAQADLDFWTDEGKRSIPFVGSFIDPTRAQLLPNRDRMKFVKDGQEIVPGVQAMAAPGHTVGHTIYMITSQGKTLCLTADIAHHYILTVENPKIEFSFDTDAKQGAATRIRIFDMLAAQRIPMLAYHFPWPGMGHLAKRGDGFHFEPVPLTTTL